MVKMAREAVFGAVAAQRRQIADLIDNLDESQLSTASLCVGWDIKTVAAHLVSVFDDSFGVFAVRAVRRRSLSRAIDELARRRAAAPAAEIAGALRRNADFPLSPPMFGPLAPLADNLIHHGDIRIPLDLPFQPDPELTVHAMEFLTGGRQVGFVAPGLLRGIRLHGADVDRGWGEGAEIRGPVAALMMSVAGRAALLDQLDGPGLALFRRRLTGQQPDRLA